MIESATELHGLLNSGQRSSAEILAAVAEQIAAREPEVGAWQYLPEKWPHSATEGPLSGVPIGIKDIFDTADMPTECGSSLYSGRQPDQDSWCVAKLREAGALIVGKTVTTEFAYFGAGKTRNPHDLGRTPGGSSSGSAAAVADGMVPVAVGSQTAGSTTRPASFCGTAALSVSHGTFPVTGVCPLAPSLDTLGLFARNVSDLRLLFSALSDQNVTDSVPRSANALKILVSDGTQFGPVSEEMLNAFGKLRSVLGEAGVSCTELALGPGLARLCEDQSLVMAVEAAQSLAFSEPRAEELSKPLRELLDRGRNTSAEDYQAAMARRAPARAELLGILDGYDAILLPAALGVAPEGLGSTGDPALSRPWHVLGMPAVTLPGYRSPAGLPLGMQLVGAPGTDPALLDTAEAIEPLMPR